MKQRFDQLIIPSFMLWFDNTLLMKGSAFTNLTDVPLVKTTDSAWKGKVIYASPYKEWVADSSISGATIPSSIKTNGSTITRGTRGMRIDFKNGRVIFDSGASYTSATCSFSVKEFGIEYTSSHEEKVLFDTKFYTRQELNLSTTGLKENERVFPIIFLKYNAGKNFPVQFGQGIQGTNPSFRAVILADSGFALEGVCGIFRDTQATHFPILTASEIPFDRYGDFKSGSSFNYQTLVSEKSSTSLIYLNRVSVSKLDGRINRDVHTKASIAVIDFDLIAYRNPKNE